MDEPSICPVPQVPRPRRGSLRCSGSRKRHRRKLEVWKVAASMVHLLNGLDEGTFRQHTQRRPCLAADTRSRDVVGSISSGILPEAKRYVERRRGLAPTGVPAIARLLKATTAGYGAARASETVHVPLEALAVDELADDLAVVMLEALPHAERQFYSDEANLVDPEQ